MVNTYLGTNEREVKNNAGGLVYKVSNKDRLERFLILGTVGGTFYVNERDLTKQNLDAVARIIEEDGRDAVDVIREVGTSNRAPKHDPVLVAYAMAVSARNPATRAYALSFFNDIVRTGTHLFHFLSYVEQRRGWGRALRRAVAGWYLNRSNVSLANQLVKYKSRDGWSHRDALRLSHAKAASQSQNALLKFAVSGTLEADDSKAHEFVEAAIRATHSDDLNEVVELVKTYNLPREVVNTKFLNTPEMWEALSSHMGMMALLRNLRNMTKDGYLVQGSDAVRVIRDRLVDQNDITRSRIHPAHVFMAMKMADSVPDPIRNALNTTFFSAFGNVEPTNKRIMLALDVSGSMDGGAYYTGRGVQVASAREWVALQAMVTARTEPFAEFRAFSDRLVPIDLSDTDSMDTIIMKMSRIPFGRTDCSLPMQDATALGQKFDAFCVYTDNETWYRQSGGYGYWGRDTNPYASLSPMEALREYRYKSGIHDAKLAVVGITATDFTIADPNDFNTLDFVGFDANAPAVMADFIRG